MTFRIKFAKYGVVRFIGHLDVMRYFQKVIRRSGLPVSYSQGFSPHQLMSFALPLGVGITSDGEYMEVELDDEAIKRTVEEAAGEAPGDTSDFKRKVEKLIFEAMNNNTTEGFEILAVRKLPEPKPNTHQDKAMALVSAADYLIRVKDGYDIGFNSEEELFSAFRLFMDQEGILVTKKTKKSEREINLKEYIYGYGDGNSFYTVDKECLRSREENSGKNAPLQAGSAESKTAGISGTDKMPDAGLAHARIFAKGQQLVIRLAAGSQMNIKPELVLEAFMTYTGQAYDENAFAFHRMELFRGESNKLRSLSQ